MENTENDWSEPTPMSEVEPSIQVVEQPPVAEWTFTGPGHISRILLGDIEHDLRAMTSAAIEKLLEEHPSVKHLFNQK